MHEYSKRIAEHIKSCYGDLSSMKLEELCELEKWAKVIKDLTEYDVNKRAIEAMDEAKEEEKFMDRLGGDRMGYRGRGSRGRFVHRTGRGRSAGMGYTHPLWHMMPEMDDMYEDEYMDVMPENYRMGYSGGRVGNYGGGNRGDSGNYGGQSGNTGRYGYDDGMGYSRDGRGESSRYGRSYDEYRKAKRHYTESKNPEEQKKMKEHIDEIFEDMSDMTSEMVRDMSQEDKQKYKVKLQQIMQKIQ